MFSKSKILVLFLALGLVAVSAEDLSSSSSPFSFITSGVIYQKTYSYNGSTFSYRNMPAGKGAMSFYWSIHAANKADVGKLCVYSVAGKMIKSFDLSKSEGSLNWSMPNGKIANGIYFAVLTYGTFKKNIKIIY